MSENRFFRCNICQLLSFRSRFLPDNNNPAVFLFPRKYFSFKLLVMDGDSNSPPPAPDTGKDSYQLMMNEPSDYEPFCQDAALIVKKLCPVFFWSWDVQSDNCAICRVMLMEPCLNCQVANKTSCVGTSCASTAPFDCLIDTWYWSYIFCLSRIRSVTSVSWLMSSCFFLKLMKHPLISCCLWTVTALSINEI